MIKQLKASCIFVTIIFVFACTACAQEAEAKIKKTPEEIFQESITLDLRDIDIVEAFKYLASKAGLNIVTTKSVTGRITLTVEDARIKDIFDIMLRSNSLAFIEQGNIYTIMSEDEYRSLYGQNFSDTRKVALFRLKYAVPEQAFNLLDVMKSEIGRVLVDSESGNVLIMDTPDKITQMRQALGEFEKENLVRVFSLKYAKAKTIEGLLKMRLDSKNVGSIKADERNNQVIVQTLPARMNEIARLIKILDRQTKEVLIDTKIVKVKLSDRLDSGVEWEGLFALARTKDQGLAYLGSYPFSSVQSTTDVWRSRTDALIAIDENVGSYPFSGMTTNYSGGTKAVPGEKMHLGMISEDLDIDALMDLLQTVGESRIISNPKIVVVNNQEAKIHVGERQAFVTTTTTTGQATSTLAEEVQFVDIGIQLSLTPSINDDGFITMKVKPEISSVSSFLTTPTENQIPIVDTSMAETTVMVQNGKTVIIGGLRKEETINSREQVPFLGKIPFLKYIFSSGDSRIERTELMVLLTPHIITGDELTTGGEEDIDRFLAKKDYREYQDIESGQEVIPLDTQPKARYKDYRLTPEEGPTEIKGEKYEP